MRWITGAALVAFSCVAQAATSSDWRSRSIYQVFTDRFARTDLSTTASCPDGYEGYCGGTWNGIISKLDYIQGMGFTAIWISPVVQQVSDVTRGYNGYSAQDLYSLNSYFGTPNDLISLSAALHDRGMYLMVDVVANHMAFDGDAQSVNYSTLNPFNDESYFHNISWITNYDIQPEVELGWLGDEDYPLPDVDTTQATVRDMFSSWVQYMVATYSIDGLRVDTVKHVESDFWAIFNEAAGVYCVGEVADGDVDYVCPYQNSIDGVLGYPSYYQLTEFFTNTSATSPNLIGEIQAMITACSDTTLLGSFSENHDQPRFAYANSDVTLAKNIITYTMLADGIPIIYQGQEQHFTGGDPPYDREALWTSEYDTTGELYELVKQLNAIRSLALYESDDYLTWKTQVVYSDDHNIALRKGDPSYMTLMVVNNLGEQAETYTLTMDNVGFPAGLTVVDVLTCNNATVDATGALAATFNAGLPMVYYPYSLLSGTGWCGY